MKLTEFFEKYRGYEGRIATAEKEVERLKLERSDLVKTLVTERGSKGPFHDTVTGATPRAMCRRDTVLDEETGKPVLDEKGRKVKTEDGLWILVSPKGELVTDDE